MSQHPVVVERINDNETHLGLPDTRGTWHHMQIDNEDLLKLYRRMQARLVEIEVAAMREDATIESSEDQYELWLYNNEGQAFRYACVGSVEHGRALWKIVGAHAINLEGFAIKDVVGTPVYYGTYITDEC